MGMFNLNGYVQVAAVMFDKDTNVTIKDFSLVGTPVTSEPFPCKANTPYAFNCEEIEIEEADVTVAMMITPKVAHGVALGIFTTDLCVKIP